MDIVGFFQWLASEWTGEQKCDMCWSFGAPLTDAAANIQQLRDCCTQLMVTNVGYTEARAYNAQTGYVNSESTEMTFILYALRPSELGINNYNEIAGHSINESAWETIYKPLFECLNGTNIQQLLCDYTGKRIDITRWSATTVHKWNDLNFDGWKITGSLRVPV